MEDPNLLLFISLRVLDNPSSSIVGLVCLGILAIPGLHYLGTLKVCVHVDDLKLIFYCTLIHPFTVCACCNPPLRFEPGTFTFTPSPFPWRGCLISGGQSWMLC
jgi:hypothetical protein